MIYTYDDNPKNIAARFEGLACAVFKCKRGKDPLRIANQSIYINHLAVKPDLNGKRALSAVLIKMIFDNPTDQHIIELENDVWEALTESEIIRILDLAFEKAQNLGY
jgi:hypothetical protein